MDDGDNARSDDGDNWEIGWWRQLIDQMIEMRDQMMETIIKRLDDGDTCKVGWWRQLIDQMIEMRDRMMETRNINWIANLHRWTNKNRLICLERDGFEIISRWFRDYYLARFNGLQDYLAIVNRIIQIDCGMVMSIECGMIVLTEVWHRPIRSEYSRSLLDRSSNYSLIQI